MMSNFNLKAAAVLTLFFFVGLCSSGSLSFVHENNPSPTTETKNSESSCIDKVETTPEVTEVSKSSSDGSIVKAKKKTSWLALGVGLVAVAALAYFLLIKKQADSSMTQTCTYSNGILIVNGVSYEMVSIPAGEFQMGTTAGESYDQPVHTVRLSKRFWLGRTEVTRGLWQAVMGSAQSAIGNDYPMGMVSWDDCWLFIKKLNLMISGNPFRLPTEAEWEYACKAGTTGEYYGDINAIAWYYVNSGYSSHPVAQKQPNAFGLYDMLGNNWEWCQDWYGDYGSAYQIDPTGPSSGTYRINRGGGWTNSAWLVRSSLHGRGIPTCRVSCFGFRLAANSAGGE